MSRRQSALDVGGRKREKRDRDLPKNNGEFRGTTGIVVGETCLSLSRKNPKHWKLTVPSSFSHSVTIVYYYINNPNSNIPELRDTLKKTPVDNIHLNHPEF